jgi:HSP20 family protein
MPARDTALLNARVPAPTSRSRAGSGHRPLAAAAVGGATAWSPTGLENRTAAPQIIDYRTTRFVEENTTMMQKHQPWSLMHQLQNELENMLDSRVSRYPSTESAVSADWLPAVDVKEEDERFLVRADLPGVKPDDISITTENGMLTISGTRETRTQEESDGYRKSERVAGRFYRRFTLPETANVEKIEATTDHGVLEISIPKQPEVQPRRIDVRVRG